MGFSNRRLGTALAWLIVGFFCMAVVAYGLSGLPPGKSDMQVTPFETPKMIIWLVCLCGIPLAGIKIVGAITKRTTD